MTARLRSRMADERGVFVPGLMGAGILVSMAMLVTDGARKAFPTRGHRARAVRLRAVAIGRANDLRSIAHGEPPHAAVITTAPRSRPVALVLGFLCGAAAVGALSGAEAYFNADLHLAKRGEWGLGIGWGTAAFLSLGGVGLVSWAVAGERAPRWLRRIAAIPPLGALPDPLAVSSPPSPAAPETSPPARRRPTKEDGTCG